MSALTTVKLVLFGVVLVTGLAALLLSILFAAIRTEEHHLPHLQTDEAGQ